MFDLHIIPYRNIVVKLQESTLHIHIEIGGSTIFKI